MKEKKVEMTKTIEMIKQKTYKKNRKNTILKALISSQEKEIIKKPIQRTENITMRPKNKLKNNTSCKFCNAPNWNPTQKCPALDQICNNCGKKAHLARICISENKYKQKIQSVTENENPTIGEQTEKSESSSYRIERISIE